MNSAVETSLESRKEWTKPELRLIDIEQITASGIKSTLSDSGNNKHHS